MKIAYLKTLGLTTISIRAANGKEISRMECPAGATICVTFEDRVYDAIAFKVTKLEETMTTNERKSGHSSEDHITTWLRKKGYPVTRANWLNVAYMGNPPAEPLDAELEAELPEALQRWE